VHGKPGRSATSPGAQPGRATASSAQSRVADARRQARVGSMPTDIPGVIRPRILQTVARPIRCRRQCLFVSSNDATSASHESVTWHGSPVCTVLAHTMKGIAQYGDIRARTAHPGTAVARNGIPRASRLQLVQLLARRQRLCKTAGWEEKAVPSKLHPSSTVVWLR
jgi:hypothetical protein